MPEIITRRNAMKHKLSVIKDFRLKRLCLIKKCTDCNKRICVCSQDDRRNDFSGTTMAAVPESSWHCHEPHRQHPVTAYSSSCQRRTSSVSRASCRSASGYRERSGSVPPSGGDNTIRHPTDSHWTDGMVGLQEPGSRGTVYMRHELPNESTSNGRHLFLGLSDSEGQLSEVSSGDGSPHTSQTCSEDEEDDDHTSCHSISLEERLLKTYPIWYLPDLQRSGAIHLLQGKEDGMFLVRQSSKPETLALSVRLPPDKGPHIQHYLIEIHNNGAQYSLEASSNRFDSPPSLITYYSNCCDELPVALRLPQKVQDAKSRAELASIALLGQEFWITSMTGSASSTPSSDAPRSIAPSLSPRPLDLVFSSFGKAGITRGTSHTSLLSPHTPCGIPPSPLTPCGLPLSNGLSHGSSTSSLAPSRPPLPHHSSSGDRSSLNLNLTPLDDILKDQPTFSSFRSHPPTPLTPLKPNPPPRHSPPGTQKQPSRPSPPIRTSPSNSISKECSPMTPSECEEYVNGQPPTPPVRWARPSITSTSPSNITVTTTLTFNVNPVKAFALPFGEESQGPTDNSQDQGFQVQVSSLEISPSGNSITSQPSTNLTGSGVMNRHREGLKLQIHQSIVSPQSTPCTPATPLGTPLSEEHDGRVKMRRKKDRRRHSNHYHEANIMDDAHCYRSSLADKISDYEDLWSSPPRDISTDTSSPMEGMYSMSTFKPRSEISKSLGDLTDINQANRAVVFSYNMEKAEETLYDNKHLNGINGNSSDSVNSYRKNSSPFYIVPADALLEPERKAGIKKASSKLSRKITNRYSDSNIQWRSRKSHHFMQKIDSNEAVNGLTNSVENVSNIENEQNVLNSNNFLVNGHGIQAKNSGRGKPVSPPRIDAQGNNRKPTVPWRIDSSWEYVTYDSDDGEDSHGEGRFPVGDKSGETDSIIIPGEKTVRDLISEKLPNMRLPDTQSITYSHTTRISEYDNVARLLTGKDDRTTRIPPPSPHFPSTISDSGTEFSEPWDSRKWDSILHGGDDDTSLDHFPRSCTTTPARPVTHTDDSDIGVTDSESLVPGEVVLGGSDEDTSSFAAPTLSLANSNNLNTNLRSRILSPQMLALRHRQDAESGTAIRKYALDLGGDKATTFSQAVSNFITCTLETNERDPAIIVRNVRQFMSGMKNYLVRSGEKEFQATLKKECSNLKSTEFLNLDAILEDVLVRLVLRPLWTHITNLYIDYYTSNGSIQKLTTNINYAKSVQYVRLGIRSELSPPRGAALDAIKSLLKKMQRVYAPREKLGHLLGAISHIYHAMYESNEGEPASGDADDLVPMIMWVLSQAGIVSAEVEADYMSGLLLPSSASGEASYYLTAFHSAIHSLKNLTPTPESSPGNSLSSIKYDNSLLPDQLVLKIMVPDEKNGSIVTRTVPIKPGITTREVCKMMALKMKVTNPQDYGLYKLVDGQESILADNECPHKIKTDLGNHGFHCLIAFKRMDAKIAWPILKA